MPQPASKINMEPTVHQQIYNLIKTVIPEPTDEGTTFLIPHTQPSERDGWAFVLAGGSSIRALDRYCEKHGLTVIQQATEAIERHLRYLRKREAMREKRRQAKLDSALEAEAWLAAEEAAGPKVWDETLQAYAREVPADPATAKSADESFLRSLGIAPEGSSDPESGVEQ